MMRAFGLMLLVTMLLLAGCGRKGPLYQPQPNAAKQAAITVLCIDNSPRLQSIHVS